MNPMPPSRFHASAGFHLMLLLLAVMIPGCLFVRVTDHRIRLNDDGSGEAMLRLVDIRSDGVTDSSITKDFEGLKTGLGEKGDPDFERDGRKITSKQMYVHGDTLIGEITYTFPNLFAIYGMHVTGSQLFVVVPEGREVLKTNGTVEPWVGKANRIVWDHDATRLMMQIRERDMPPTVSLAPLYSGRRH